MKSQLVFENVDIWDSSGVSRGQDVHLESGIVTHICPHMSRELPSKTLKAPGSVLMPAGVDGQVHLRVPGQEHKETPEMALKAAVQGGVGAVLTMPNTQPTIDSPEVLRVAIERCKKSAEDTGVRILWSAAITMGQKGEAFVDARALKAAGCAALTDDGRGVARDDMMLMAFKASAELDLPILQHAETPGHGGVLAPGPVQKKLGLPPYFDEAEVSMVERDINLLRQHPKARYHVLHVSSRRTLALVSRAKNEGLRVTCEVSPHHLLLTANDISEKDSSFKMNPPLRSPEDVEDLVLGLVDGRVEFCATDHAPHEPEAKGRDFAKSAWGTTGLETMLRSLLELYARGRLKEARLVEVFSTKAAEFYGIGSSFGQLKPGRPFNAVWLDPKAPRRPIELSDLYSKSKNNVFLGRSLPGALLGTFLGERIHLF